MIYTPTTNLNFKANSISKHAQPQKNEKLVPALGNILLNQLRPEHLQRYYFEKLSNGRCNGNGGLSPRSVRYHHVTLHIILKTAVKGGLMSLF